MTRPVSNRADPRRDLADHQAELLAVERVRESDALALEVIFAAYRPELVAQAERVTASRAVAEEVVQDVFLAIWVGRQRWRINTTLGAYLRRAVNNVASRAATSRTRGPSSGVSLDGDQSSPDESALVSNAPQPDVAAERTALADAVREATVALPPRARAVFTLSRDEDLTNREIATKLGVSIKTVETHMTRALAFLRARLRGWHE